MHRVTTTTLIRTFRISPCLQYYTTAAPTLSRFHENPTLIGPPEIYTSDVNSTTAGPAAAATTTTTTTPSDPFMQQMITNFNANATDSDATPMGFTENRSPTFLSSGNPCLDFFFHVVPDTPSETLIQRLQLAWSHNPLTTLKLVCNLRGVRGTGKSDRNAFYAAALWFHNNHPKTLAYNIPSFADFGYFKDLPEILYRLLQGSDIRDIQKEEWRDKKKEAGEKRYLQYYNRHYLKKKSNPKRLCRNKKEKESKTDSLLRAKVEKELVHLLRVEKRVAMATKLLHRYNNDPNFRILHDRISHHFADCLKQDLEFLKSGSSTKISLAAKWCPSIHSSFDRSTLLCESIARRMFPYDEYEGVEEAHYVYRVRDRLRKEVLVPLRKVLELPEVFIGDNRWDLIPYNRVASVAMKFYKEKFLKHDKERFEKYLKDVKSGKTTIAAGALLPHEIIESLRDGNDGEVAELQWKRMVDDLLKEGKMRNCIAVCDVSGSMYGTPLEVSVALGLLVSELCEEPWKGKVITFSKNPQLHLIKGSNLKSKIKFVENMQWNMNTNFQKVFDCILKVAVNGNLKADQMIKRVFVFSDMEFDEASLNPWETDYQAITRKYTEKGYGSAVPQIVFWNLRDSKATPVPATQKGVALVSGFSKNLLKLFLNNDGDLGPVDAMEAAISGPEYQKLVVLD